jgi:hypothetical protein
MYSILPVLIVTAFCVRFHHLGIESMTDFLILLEFFSSAHRIVSSNNANRRRSQLWYVVPLRSRGKFDNDT